MARAEKAGGATPWGRETTGAYRIRNADGEGDTAAELILYSEIGGWFGGTAEDFAAALGSITAKELTVRLNSPGGSVWEGLAIANLLRSHPARVTVSVDGIAASIASVILMAGDHRLMQPQTQVMVHDAWGVTVGNPADHREMADLLDKQSDNIAAAYRDRSGGRIDTWRNRMRAETWFTAEEALAAGLADEVAAYPRNGRPAEEPDEGEPDEDMPAAAQLRQWDLSVFRYAGRDKAPAPADTDAATGDDTARKTPPAADFAEQLRAAVAVRDAVRDGFAAAGLAIADTAVGPHESAAEEGTWSRSDNEGRLPSPVPLATARKFYGAYDDDRAEDGAIPKGAGHLPHHFVSEDGTPGAASISGVKAALARLGQTHGLGDEEKATVERHLRGHLPDSGSEDRAEPRTAPPPEPPAEPVLAFGRPQTSRQETLAFGRGGTT